jgi:putative glutamine amidotransferase
VTAVGICAAVEEVRWGVWDMVVAMSPRAYAHAVQNAGGVALILPPDDGAIEDPDQVLDRVDALILAGGADVDPASYGAKPHPETSGTWPERDRFELAMAHRALERDMPVLGICRGMQMLNVACGGTLVQHLPEVVGHEDHRHTPGTFGDHEVRLEPGSLAQRAAEADVVAVKSHHHQGVDELGEGLTVTGWAAEDDTVEAIELADKRFALGVLWHPEEDMKSRVIATLVKEAAA